jgi:thymidine kinase
MYKGVIDVVFGPMFSSKSTELITRYNKFKSINIPIIAIKPQIDNRYTDSNYIFSHDNLQCECILLKKLSDLDSDIYKKTYVILIDEAQFFDDLIEFTLKAADQDYKHIIAFGLNGDYQRNPFGTINKLIPHADSITHIKGYCSYCNDGTIGLFTLRTIKSDEQILIGEKDKYRICCRKHYNENK